MPDLRQPYTEALIELAKEDGRLAFLYSDVGFSFLEKLENIIGDRCINTGITEFATVAMAAGMASEGMIPYVYSMACFSAIRPYEAIRNLIAFDRKNVKILGVSGSEAYRFLGVSHNPLNDNEDFRLLESLPNIKCFRPESPDVARTVAKIIHNIDGPVYCRI